MANPWDVSFGAPTKPKGQTQPMFPGTPEPEVDEGDALLQQILERMKADDLSPDVAQGATDIGSLLSGFGTGQQQNRIAGGNLTQDYDTLMLNAQQGRNANESDAMRKLAQTSYIKSGGAQSGPRSISLGGQTRELPSFGSAARPASAEMKQGAETLQSMLLDRLKSGGSYQPTEPTYTKPGMAENIGSYGGAVAGGLGAMDSILHGDTGKQGNILKDIGGWAMKGLRKIF